MTIPNVEVWALPRDGEPIVLTDLGDYELSRVDGDVGSVSLSYPMGGEGWELLQALQKPYRRLLVEIRTDGTAATARRAMLTDAQGDSTKAGSIWTITGLYLGMVMAHARCPYSDDGENGDTLLEGTPGQIIRTLMVRAQARGTLLDVGYASFTNATDSAGQPWAMTATLTFSPGRDYLSILQEMTQKYGLIDWEMTADRELRVWNAGTRGRDRTVPVPGGVPVDEDGAPITGDGFVIGPGAYVGPGAVIGPGEIDPDAILASGQVVLEYGRDFSDGPVTSSNREVGTNVLGVGVNGMYQEAENAQARAELGERIEVYADFGSVYDDATLQALTQDAAQQRAVGSHSYSHELHIGEDSPVPGVDYDVGDWILRAINGATEKLKVAQLVLRRSGGKVSASVTLGDLRAEQAVKTQQQLDAIQNGSSIVGTSTQPPDTDDGKAPAAPANLALSTRAYYDGGTPRSTVTASWSDVLTNEDGTALDDLSGYEVSYRYEGTSGQPEDWIVAGLASDNGLYWGGIVQDVVVFVRVRAQDKWNRFGPYSAEVGIRTASDADAPPTPSLPLVTSYLGILTVQWDGLGSSGEQMPGDFRECEVHLSTVGPLDEPDRPAGGLALSETYVGSLRAGGVLPIPVGEYGTRFYARLVAVDQTGNASGASPAGDAVLEQAKDGDLAGMSIGKLTAGVMQALMTVSGIIRTANSGSRVELDPAGFRCLNDADLEVFAYSIAAQLLTIIGRVSTGEIGSGAAIVMDPSADLPGTAPFPSLLMYSDGGVVGPGRLNSVGAGGGRTATGLNSGPTDTTAAAEQSTLILFPDRATLKVNTLTNATRGGLVDLTKTEASIGVAPNGNMVAGLSISSAGQVDIITPGGARLAIGTDGSVVLGGINNAYLWMQPNGRTILGSRNSQIVLGDTSGAYATPVLSVGAMALSSGPGINDGAKLKAIGGDAIGFTPQWNEPQHTFYWVNNYTGDLVKNNEAAPGYKTFVIDHPTDPDRYLVHVATEAPDAAVEYAGVAELVGGQAVVELPSYFEALTHRDGRTVQVTMLLPEEPLVAFAPLPVVPEPVVPFARLNPVVEEIPERLLLHPVAASLPVAGRFRIVSPAPDGTQVAWRVRAIRADAPPVEVEPLRSDYDAHGDGPYRYLTPREDVA